jgi:uncharacterized membrane protein
MRFVIAYIAVAVVFLVLDALWLGMFALGLYRRELGPLLLDKPNLSIAAVFYLLMVGGVVLLAVLPALDNGGWTRALWMGAVLGLVAYATYDITNLSTLRNWSLTVTLIDLAWGTIVTAVSAVAGTLAVGALGL